jgi:inhibitor of cysteine peptidase
MKNYWIGLLIAVLLLVVPFTGCSTAVQAHTDSARVIDAGINQEFTIAMGSNPTTGYSWQADFDKVNLNQEKDEYKADDHSGKNLVGAGGTQYFTFKALKAGETRITFSYRRPWEPASDQDQKQVFTINVK